MKGVTRIILFSLFFSFFFMGLPAASFASETEENILRIQKAYADIKDLRGSFSQKSILKDLNKTETYKGEFFIKPPMKMKWIYKGKTAQDLTINNDTVLIFKKGDKQAYKGKFDRSTYGQTPVALLGGFGNIREEFGISGKGDAIILKPKNPMGHVTLIKIIIAEEGFPIRSFIISDSHSNVIEIELKDIRTNTGLKDSLFELSLPKGVNVFEQ